VDALVEDYIMQTDDHAFPVMEEDRLIGIVCLDDVRKIPADQRSTKTISDIMTPRSELITTSPDDSAQEAMKLISRKDVRQLVVMENDQLFGLVRRRDIVRFLQLQSDEFSPAQKPKGQP
jgi:CBS domain-containing protein